MINKIFITVSLALCVVFSGVFFLNSRGARKELNTNQTELRNLEADHEALFDAVTLQDSLTVALLDKKIPSHWEVKFQTKKQNLTEILSDNKDSIKTILFVPQSVCMDCAHQEIAILRKLLDKEKNAIVVVEAQNMQQMTVLVGNINTNNRFYYVVPNELFVNINNVLVVRLNAKNEFKQIYAITLRNADRTESLINHLIK